MMDQFQAKFIEEANDLIATLEKTLLALEQQTDDKSLVEKVFRVMHTLKGNSSMFGFDKMGAVTHDLETIYDFVRAGKREVSRELLNLTFASLDHFKILLSDPQLSNEQAKAIHQQLMQQIQDKIQAQPAEQLSPSNLASHPATAERLSQERTYYILFKPREKILLNGTNPLYLIDELHSLGTCRVVPHTELIPALENLDFTVCYTFWEIYLTTQSDENAIKDVFIFVEDECEIKIEQQVQPIVQQVNSLVRDIAEQAAAILPDSNSQTEHLPGLIKKKAQTNLRHR
jgi:two-component system, chemotaxis family, sensor kinase CheA